MSPLAAALFLLVAVSLVNVFPPAARVHLLVEMSTTCAALVLAGGAVVTMGYLLGAPLLYGGPIKPVAMPTGIAFVLAGAGLLARLQVLAGGSDNKGAALVAVGLGVAVSFGLYAIVETAELAASMPHVPWRGRALLAGCLGLTWLLAVFLRAQGRHRTETERANRELHAAEARMHAVIESANDAIVTTDIRGAIVSWNAAAERIFGYTGEEAARMTLSELIPERLREADRGGLERAADSGKFYLAGLAGELVGFRKSGVEFPVELSVARWSVADDVFFTAIMRDITERRQAEELEAVVLEISQSANQAADLGQLLRSIHEAVKRLMNARNFYVALHDPETGLLSFPYFVDESDPPPAPRPSRRGLTEYVLRTCKPQFVNPEMIEDLVQRGEIELVGTPAVDWLGGEVQPDAQDLVRAGDRRPRGSKLHRGHALRRAGPGHPHVHVAAVGFGGRAQARPGRTGEERGAVPRDRGGPDRADLQVPSRWRGDVPERRVPPLLRAGAKVRNRFEHIRRASRGERHTAAGRYRRPRTGQPCWLVEARLRITGPREASPRLDLQGDQR